MTKKFRKLQKSNISQIGTPTEFSRLQGAIKTNSRRVQEVIEVKIVRVLALPEPLIQ
jgi:hypothetical protein